MPTIVHFDISADDMDRAKRFYEELFGWKFQPLPGPADYYLIETTNLNNQPGVGGGMAKRDKPEDKIINYIAVKSLDEYVAKVVELGGKLVGPKSTVPGWGYSAACLDTEGNIFGLWEDDKNAK